MSLAISEDVKFDCSKIQLKYPNENFYELKDEEDRYTNVNNEKEMKDYLWKDVSTNHLFKSREELDTRWEIEKEEK